MDSAKWDACKGKCWNCGKKKYVNKVLSTEPAISGGKVGQE